MNLQLPSLVYDYGALEPFLEILSLPNQDSPIMLAYRPVLGPGRAHVT